MSEISMCVLLIFIVFAHKSSRTFDVVEKKNDL